MDKKAALRQLAEEVSRCHLCAQLKTPPHSTYGEYLENDGHGLDTDTPYVNLWNLWNYNLDADILVVGQDYGTREEFAHPTTADLTETTLKTLFHETFGIDLTAPNAPVFFTNAACCYRHNKTTGGAHTGWLPICANKFLGRLIAIIQPKIIIALGYNAFTALSCLDGLPLTCHDPRADAKDTLADTMRGTYSLTAEGKDIAVFPVYHTGALGHRNRPIEQQKEDWRRIAAQMPLPQIPS